MTAIARLWKMSAVLATFVVWHAGTANAQDVGDAPAPYPTAEHTQDFERFGDTRGQADATNPETPAWTGSVEDDGITVSNLVKGGTAMITVNIQQLFAQDDIAVWIDWNDDGAWDTPSERVIWAGASPNAPDGTLVAGDNVFLVAVPAGAIGTSAGLRARIWDTTAFGADPLLDVDGGGTPSGLTTWGEVEDHLIPYIVLDNPEVDVQRPLGFSTPSGGTDDIGAIDTAVATSIDWFIVNQGASNDLTFTNASTLNLVNCTANITSQATSPVTAGNNSSFTIEITALTAGPFSFDVTFDSNDVSETTYTFSVIGAGGVAGTFLVSNDASETPDFADLGAAFDFLEATPVSGPVVLEVSEGTGPYTSDASHAFGDTAVVGLSAVNTLTIRAQAGERPVITGAGANSGMGNGTVALIDLTDTTFQGFELVGGDDYGLGVSNDAGSVMSAVSIERNMIHGVTTGAGLIVFGGGGTGTVSDFNIANNFIWDVAASGFPPFPGAPGGLVIGETMGGTVRHNTVVVNTGTAVNGAALTVGPLPAPLADVSFNIFIAATAGYNILDNAFAFPLSADYNVYYLTNGATAFSAQEADLAAWQVASGLDANSSDADPELLSIVNPTEDLHLTTTSFVPLEAATGSTEAFDIDGDARPIGAGREIGADEIFIGPSPPIIDVFVNGMPVNNGSNIPMTLGDTIADLNLEFRVRDPNSGDTVDLSAMVTNSGNITGFVQNEWEASGSLTFSATPMSGTVDALGTMIVYLAADDNTGNITGFSFSLDVDNSAPVIAVTTDGNTVNADDILTVQDMGDVADLVLAFSVTDPDTGDNLALTHSLTNGGAISGRVSSEWNATGTGGSISTNPLAGTFTGTGTITVNLTADDGAGGGDTFRFRIRINDGPGISVLSGVNVVGDDDSLSVSEGATVASLGLSFRVNDNDSGDTLDLSTTVTASADIDGFVQSEWDANGTGGSIETQPATGTFDTPGTITVQLDADDGSGSMSTMSFTIVVNAAPVIAVTTDGTAVADMDVINVTINDTVASLALDLTATDANTGDDLTLTTDVDDEASILDFDGAEWMASGTGGSISATPATGTFDRLGQIDVTVMATDGNGDATPLMFTISVNEPGNNAPVLVAPNSLGDVVVMSDGSDYAGDVDSGGDLGLAFQATDEDGDTITVTVEVTGGSLAADAAGLSETFPVSADAASSATASVSGEAADSGTIELTVTATDDRGGMARYVFTLTIADGGGGGCSCLVGGSTEDKRGTVLLAMLVVFGLVRRRRGSLR
jgi:MYXO-CTERM domain-containing protein